MQYDVIVLGAGAAACGSAFEAARCGFDVLWLPGAGTPAGSEPSTFPSAAHHLRDVAAAGLVGSIRPPLAAGPSGARGDLDRLRRQRSLAVAHQIRLLVEQLHGQGIQLDARPVTLRSSREICVGDDSHVAERVIIATGTRPRHPARFDFDGRMICDPESLVGLERLPRSLLVVGSEGAGCELACTFAALGSKVTVVDRRSRTLRYLDRDVLERLHVHMRRLGIELVLEEDLEVVDVHGDWPDRHATVHLSSGRLEVCDCLAVVAGRVPNVDGFDLAGAGIETDSHGFIVADERSRTSVPGVFAAGDVVSQLGECAEVYQGRAAARDAMGLDVDPTQSRPFTIRTIPEVSMVGITEEMCQRLDVPCVTGIARSDELPSRQIRASPDRLKLVASCGSGEILGVQIIGQSASEMIALGTLLVDRAFRLEDVANLRLDSTGSSLAYAVAANAALSRRARSRTT